MEAAAKNIGQEGPVVFPLCDDASQTAHHVVASLYARLNEDIEVPAFEAGVMYQRKEEGKTDSTLF